MRFGLISGLGLLAAAFVAAAAEMAAQAQLGSYGVISAYSTLYTLLPGKFIVTQILVEKHLHPLVWDPIIRSILVLPGWLILGVPGAILAWRNRPDRDIVYEDDDQLPYTTFEEIVAAAEEADFADVEDRGSKYQYLEEYDPTEIVSAETIDDEMLKLGDETEDDDQVVRIPPPSNWGR